MTADHNARLASKIRVRDSQPRASQAERMEDLRAPPRRTSTRFRLERVSLLPFVPAPLLASIERARLRRRARWALIVLAGSFAASALLAWLLR